MGFFADPDGNVLELNASLSDGLRGDAGGSEKSLELTAIDHVARETGDVHAAQAFYTNILGLPPVERPGNRKVGFETAWIQFPDGPQMHFIAEHPDRPMSSWLRDSELTSHGRNEEDFIRRCHHVALTVQDIDAVKIHLEKNGIPYAVNAVPGTPIVQLFLHDSDGNGIAIGNFSDAMSKI